MSAGDVGGDAVVVAGLFDDILDASDGSPQTSAGRAPIEIRIEAISRDLVIAHDKERFNNNNLHDYEISPVDPTRLVKRDQGPWGPDDYNDVHRRCNTSEWVDSFRPHYRVLNLPRVNLGWMQSASHLAIMKEGLSPLFASDISDTVNAVDTGDIFARTDRNDPMTGYFVRTETVSLKQGIHGVGPYFDLKSILESSVTAGKGHQAVDHRTAALKYYLFPWRTDLHEFREFRVFVCNNRVTALSQQSLYRVNSIIALCANDEDKERLIRNWVEILVPYINTVVVERLSIKSFVLDIVLVGPPPTEAGRDGYIVDLHEPTLLRPFFIETNAFGFNYGAGSSLFSWIEHFSTLYGLSDEARRGGVSFRYTVE